MHPYLQSLLGGLCIGAAALWLMASLGRVMGVSGIAASAIRGERGERGAWRWAFLGALLIGGLVFGWLFNVNASPVQLSTPLLSSMILLPAGVLVGVGTVLGSGCTSGHGVCGIARGSKRSIVATLVFMASGAVTVAVLNAIGVRV